MPRKIQIKNVSFEEGVDHLRVKADIYCYGIKIGEVIDDGWCDELYLEVEDEKKINCNDCKKIKDLFVKLRGYKNIKVNDGYYQLIFC